MPTHGSRTWVEGLGLKERAHWRPWLASDGGPLGAQVGGYVVEYEGASANVQRCLHRTCLPYSRAGALPQG